MMSLTPRRGNDLPPGNAEPQLGILARIAQRADRFHDRCGVQCGRGEATLRAHASPHNSSHGDPDARLEPGVPRYDDPTLAAVTAHSLFWLTAGNAVGTLMAALLIWPGLHRWLGPFTYGRWAPVHTSIHLYGWCSIPLVGLLFRFYLPANVNRWLSVAMIQIWSGTLLFGAITWGHGVVSGKLFLDWIDAARILFCLNLVLLWCLLAYGYRRSNPALPDDGGSLRRLVRISTQPKVLLLWLLAFVPGILYWAAGLDHYPAINPDSGGSTGTSLLGSTLGILAIFGVLPFLLTAFSGARRSAVSIYFGAFIAYMLVFMSISHGDVSNHDPKQIVALATLFVWLPLLVWYYRQFSWPPTARLWLTAFFGWFGLLLITAEITFFPRILERLKFTNALVGHAHAAMAGVVSSFNMLVLSSLHQHNGGDDGQLAARGPFFLWHTGGLVLFVSLTIAGWMEAQNQGMLFRAGGSFAAVYGVRLVGGIMMLVASVYWLSRGCAARSERG